MELKSSRFYFNLPDELIAQNPPEKRGESRLLVYQKGKDRIIHTYVKNFPDFIEKDSLIVLNNTKVRKARIYGLSETGGKTEFLLLSQLDQNKWSVICSKSKKQKTGKSFSFPENLTGIIAGEEEEQKILEFSFTVDDAYLDRYGHIPLPPYIRREDTAFDSDRYQTVYSSVPGSAAAPTAGLHFTDKILNNVKESGSDICYVTLHIGQGTFQPVRTENIEDHKMHEEHYEVSEETADLINKKKEAGKKIIALGTTSLRTIESSGSSGRVVPGQNKTSLYIYPGYSFRQADQLFTNFHTPDSTLILLVSAFAGENKIREIYSEAVNKKYMFFSYGDAMFIAD